jgi:hypothetical protein
MRAAWVVVLVLGGCRPPDRGERVAATTAPAPRAADTARSGELPESPGVYYTVRAAEDLASLEVEVCFVGARPERLEPPMAGARAYLARMTAGGREVACAEDGIGLAELGDCVRYEVDTAAVIRDGSAHDGAALVGDDALISPDFWLWMPVPRSDAVPLHARFVGPMEAAVPWPREARGSFPYRVPESLFAWRSQAAVGRLERSGVRMGEAEIDVVFLGDAFGDRREAVRAWVERSAQAGASLLGGFPVARSQVLCVPDGARRQSFGYAMRGGGASATLLLPTPPTDAELAADWSAVHELLHFALPSMPVSEAWFYEGVVTYLTAVARARAGMLTSRAAWWELLDGFVRGAATGTGVSLREESRTMHETHSYWRVYWAGAAIALEVDVDLHRRGKSLAALVGALARSDLDPTASFTGEDLYARIDALAGGGTAAATASRHLEATVFPDTADLSARLGVRLGAREREAVVDPRSPEAAVAAAIMGQ